jgi:putative transposase
VQAIDEIRNSHNLILLGYVVMPEHVHLVVVPPIEAKLGTIIGELKRMSSKRIHDILASQKSPLLEKFHVIRHGVGKFALWQIRCYDHNCRTPESIWEKVNYCHNNPVKRGLVGGPENWEWSSYRWYSGKRKGCLKINVEQMV